MAVKAKPDGYHTATPYLHIKGAPKAIEFYKEAFGATEVMRLEMAPGVIAHAEIKIGDSHIMLAEENAEWGNLSPTSLGGPGLGMMLYVDDVDAVFARAVAAGATAKMPPTDMFYGDRCGNLIDPFGHSWSIATHIEDVSVEECQARMMKLFAPAA